MKTFSALAGILLTASFGFAQDETAPSILTASVSPSAVDVTAATVTVTATLRVTDDDSGFHYGNLFLYSPAGDFVDSYYFDDSQRTGGGNDLDATYAIPVEVPRYGPPGTWRVDAFVQDQDGNRRNVGGPDVENTPFPDPAAMTLSVTNTGPVDTTDPTVSSNSLTPGAVDVTTTGKSVTFTFVANDALAGLSYGFIYPHAPNGEVDYDLLEYFDGTKRTSGTAQNGTYQVVFNFPQGSEVGEWTFEIFLHDAVGNTSFSPAGSVLVSGTAPTSGVSFVAQAVDAVHLPFVTTGGGWVMDDEETADGIDAACSLPIPHGGEAEFQTTVTGPGTVSFDWQVSSEPQDRLSVLLDGSEEDAISGEIFWTDSSVNVPSGEHTITWRYAKNGSISGGDDRGWVDRVRFISDDDESPPRLQDLRFSSRSVDVTSGTQDITVALDVTDDQNGIDEVSIQFIDPTGTPRFTISTIAFGDTEGTYEFDAEIPDDLDFGLWRVEVSLKDDGTGETARYGPGPGGEDFPTQSMEFFYVGDPSSNDGDAPVVGAIEAQPSMVDVSTEGQEITVTLQIIDAQAGFVFGDIEVLNPTGGSTGSIFINSSDRISGDEHNGIYQVNAVVPSYGRPGSWSFALYLDDGEGNSSRYPYQDPFPVGLNRRFTVTNTGLVDLTPPEVTSIDITPTQADISSGPKQIQVTVAISDNLSGIQDAYAYFYNPANVYQPGLFTQLIASNRISGNDMAAVHQFTKTLPQDSAVGQWKVRIFLRDRVGETSFYGGNGVAFPEPGDGFFTLTSGAASLYDSFAATYSLAGADALPDADPDRDGRNNATELMLGTHPNSAASAGAGLTVLTRDATHLHFDFTVAPTLTVTVQGGVLSLSDGSGGAPLTVGGQTSSSLTGSWTAVTPTLLSGNTWRVSLPLASGSKGFVRLILETP